jgi:hypothetical protein
MIFLPVANIASDRSDMTLPFDEEELRTAWVGLGVIFATAFVPRVTVPPFDFHFDNQVHAKLAQEIKDERQGGPEALTELLPRIVVLLPEPSPRFGDGHDRPRFAPWRQCLAPGRGQAS